MKAILKALTAVALLGSSVALADEEFDEDQAAEEATAAPTSSAPSQLPPAPAANPGLPTAQVAPPAAAPVAQAPVAQPPVAQATVPGQWTYTSQYGWVYLPYEQNYTYVTDDGVTAYQYAWYPAYGWRWVAAPWVLGWGPSPYWGTMGYTHFAWHTRPWFHVGVYGGGYRSYGYHSYGPRYGYGHSYGHTYSRGYGIHGGGPVHSVGPVHGGGAVHGGSRGAVHSAGRVHR